MRNAIQQYTLDKQAAPSSLDDLVSAKYLGTIPVDPITRAKDWKVAPEDILLTPGQTSPVIKDVHSPSKAIPPSKKTPKTPGDCQSLSRPPCILALKFKKDGTKAQLSS